MVQAAASGAGQRTKGMHTSEQPRTLRRPRQSAEVLVIVGDQPAYSPPACAPGAEYSVPATGYTCDRMALTGVSAAEQTPHSTRILAARQP